MIVRSDFINYILVIACASLILMYALFNKKRIVKWEKAPLATRYSIKKNEKLINRIIFAVIGFFLLLSWFSLASDYFGDESTTLDNNINSEAVADFDHTPSTFIAILCLAVTLVINAPLLLLARHWYKDKTHQKVAVRLPKILILVFTYVPIAYYFILILLVYGYIFIPGTEQEVLVIGFLLITIHSVLGCMFGRWKVSVQKNSILIRPIIGVRKNLSYDDITEIIINESGKLKVISNGKKIVSIQPQCHGYDEFKRLLQERNIKILIVKGKKVYET